VQARDTARAHEEFSKSRFAGGVGNRLDAVRAAQERASSETRVQSQTIALIRAQEALGILLGENGPIDAVDVTLGAPPTLATALSEAESRSDIVASKQRVESSRKSVRDSYADYMPLLTGIAQPFYQSPATLTLPTTGWQAQLLLTIPLFDGGYRYGAKNEREALYDQSKTKLDAALRQARSEVRVGFEAVQRADDALIQARDAAKLAQEALELSQLAYRAGATSNIEVVDAERRARDAATDAAVAEDAARQARLDLLSAAGKFP
jgi:outer membrane protein TolC